MPERRRANDGCDFIGEVLYCVDFGSPASGTECRSARWQGATRSISMGSETKRSS